MSQPRLKKKSVLVVHPGDNLTPPGEHNYIKKLLRMREQGLFPASGRSACASAMTTGATSLPAARATASR